MAITVTNPTHIGPGYVIFFSGLTGPVPVDDYFSVGVRETGGSNFLTAGVKVCHGFTSGVVVLGQTDGLAIAPGLDRYIAPGAAVNMEWAQVHHDFTIVDSGTVSALDWDPTGGAYILMQQLLQGAGGGGATLDEILAAVTRTYP